MLLFISWLLLVVCNNSSFALSETVYDEDCDPNSTDCVINCDDCDNEINCPTTPDCNSCIINCNDGGSCRRSKIYSHSCQNVVINCQGSGNAGVVQDTTIYAPNNFGNLTLNTLSGKCFKKANIVSSDQGTGHININCAKSDQSDECKEMNIDATNAQSLEFTCSGGAKCEETKVYCPNNNYAVDRYWGTPCLINCDDTNGFRNACNEMKVYAMNGINMDATWYCDNNNNKACDDSFVYCDYSLLGDYSSSDSSDTSSSCEWSHSNNNNNDWSCQGPCHNTKSPTNIPSQIPSFTPTIKPTSNPTHKPSLPPITTEPTNRPSNMPTNSPSNLPTNLPSYQPTINPTINPTIKPSNKPTKLPSELPTETPTGIPSNYPSIDPTNKPSITPSNFPSIEPTIIPSIGPTSQSSIQLSTATARDVESTVTVINNQLSSTPIESTIEPTDTSVTDTSNAQYITTFLTDYISDVVTTQQTDIMSGHLYSTNIQNNQEDTTNEPERDAVNIDNNNNSKTPTERKQNKTSEIEFIFIIIALGTLCFLLFLCLIGLLFRRLRDSNSKIRKLSAKLDKMSSSSVDTNSNNPKHSNNKDPDMATDEVQNPNESKHLKNSKTDIYQKNVQNNGKNSKNSKNIPNADKNKNNMAINDVGSHKNRKQSNLDDIQGNGSITNVVSNIDSDTIRKIYRSKSGRPYRIPKIYRSKSRENSVNLSPQPVEDNNKLSGHKYRHKHRRSTDNSRDRSPVSTAVVAASLQSPKSKSKSKSKSISDNKVVLKTFKRKSLSISDVDIAVDLNENDINMAFDMSGNIPGSQNDFENYYYQVGSNSQIRAQITVPDNNNNNVNGNGNVENKSSVNDGNNIIGARRNLRLCSNDSDEIYHFENNNNNHGDCGNDIDYRHWTGSSARGITILITGDNENENDINAFIGHESHGHGRKSLDVGYSNDKIDIDAMSVDDHDIYVQHMHEMHGINYGMDNQIDNELFERNLNELIVQTSERELSMMTGSAEEASMRCFDTASLVDDNEQPIIVYD